MGSRVLQKVADAGGGALTGTYLTMLLLVVYFSFTIALHEFYNYRFCAISAAALEAKTLWNMFTSKDLQTTRRLPLILGSTLII